MRIHNDFTLYFRVVPSGKRVVYYYAYDEDGKRLHGKSTGETTLTAARLKCNRLLKAGLLAPKKERAPTFAEYAEGWWDWDDCAYLRKRRKRCNITRGYADQSRWNMVKILLPFFGGMRMDKIARCDIEQFLDSLSGRGYQNTTINSYYGTLKTMMREAVDRTVIACDPTDAVGKLVNDRREIRIISEDEFRRLFTGDWQKIWRNNRIAYTANKLAALTGMRAGEVLGLKGAFVYDDHIFLCKQYDRYGYRDTKTKARHNIPLPPSMIDDLNELKRINGEEFVFSASGGEKPVCRRTMYLHFHRALRNIGLSTDEIARRRLHLHGWRHFFNTQMLKGGLSVTQVQAVTGHKSERMTEWYCHFDPAEFTQVTELQEALLGRG